MLHLNSIGTFPLHIAHDIPVRKPRRDHAYVRLKNIPIYAHKL
jgi:hypothetical protein